MQRSTQNVHCGARSDEVPRTPLQVMQRFGECTLPNLACKRKSMPVAKPQDWMGHATRHVHETPSCA